MNIEDAEIVIKRSDDFHKTSQEVSDYLLSLKLPKEQNDQLVALMVKLVNAAEKGGCMFGLELGIGATRALMKEESR